MVDQITTIFICFFTFFAFVVSFMPQFTGSNAVGVFLCISSIMMILWAQYFEREEDALHWGIFMADVGVSFLFILVEVHWMVHYAILALSIALKLILPTGSSYTWMGITASIFFSIGAAHFIQKDSLPLDVKEEFEMHRRIHKHKHE